MPSFSGAGAGLGGELHHTYASDPPIPKKGSSIPRKDSSDGHWYGGGNVGPGMPPTIYHEVGNPTNTSRFQQPTSLAELKQKLGTYVDHLGPSSTSGRGVDVYVGDMDSGDGPRTCQYTSGSGRVCKSTLAYDNGASVYCANHTCTASGCTASASSQESFCTAHRGSAGAQGLGSTSDARAQPPVYDTSQSPLHAHVTYAAGQHIYHEGRSGQTLTGYEVEVDNVGAHVYASSEEVTQVYDTSQTSLGAVVADGKDAFTMRNELRLSRDGSGLRAKSVRRSNPLFSLATSTIPLHTDAESTPTDVGTLAAGAGTPGLASGISMGEPAFVFDGIAFDADNGLSVVRQTSDV